MKILQATNAHSSKENPSFVYYLHTTFISNLLTVNNMNIWNVQSQTWNQIRLWRMDSDNFRVNEKGEYTPILDNATYTLINNKYAHIFQSLIGQVSVRPVRIHDFVLKTENQDYVELTLFNKIDVKTINKVESNGYKAWTYNGNLFVSHELKIELENIGTDELEFHLGFSMFG